MKGVMMVDKEEGGEGGAVTAEKERCWSRRAIGGGGEVKV